MRRASLILALCGAILAAPAGAQRGQGAAEIKRLLSAGEVVRAEEQARRMLERARARAGDDSSPVAAILILLARSLHLQGRYEEAVAVGAEGIALCQRLRGENAVRCMRGLAFHGQALFKLGRLGEAEAALRQSLAWAEGLPEDKTPLKAGIFADAAYVLGDMGRKRDAAALLEKAVALTDGRGETAVRKARAGALFFLGRLKMQQNDLAAAERSLREALRLQEELHGTAHRLTARTRYQLGHILLLQNRPEAVAELRAATEQLIQRAGERVEATTSSMSVLALALEAQGDPAEAESWHRRAIDLARRNGTPFSLARFGQRYGRFLVKQGRLEEALAAYREAVEAAEKLFAQTRGLPEELRQGVIGQFLQIYRELTSLLLRLHQQKPADGYDREAFTVTALTQSRIFSEMLRQAQVSEYAQSEHFRALKAQRDRLLDRLAAMRQGNGVEESLDDGEDESASPAAAGEPRGEAELAKAIERMEEALRREYPQYMEVVAPRRLAPARLQALLRPGEAMMSYALLRDRTVVFVMTRNRFEAVLLTLGRDGVTKRIRELRAPIEAVAVTGELGSLRDLDPAKLHDLYRQLFLPVADRLGGISRLIVIGDGPLYTLPLGMLVERYGEEERRRFAATRDAGALLAEYAELPYLGERYRIGYLPSASALAALRESAPARRPYAEQLVAFADPVFAAGGGSPAALRGGLAPLPETAEEARRIAGILDGAPARLLLGESAQEYAAKQPAMADARYVLFATHGLLGGEFVEEAETAAQQPALALAMAGDLHGEDGWLTMREVVEQMRLRAELIVLSACNTAGGAGGGEGFAGLTRAFMYAGARGLLVSHWAVESTATRDLMIETFRRLRGGADAAAALAGAQQALRATATRSAGRPLSRAHPFFWAPFVFVGD